MKPKSLYADLKNGETVTLADGRTIHPHQVQNQTALSIVEAESAACTARCIRACCRLAGLIGVNVLRAHRAWLAAVRQRSGALQVCDPDLQGRGVVVTGMFPSHPTIRSAMPHADLVLHDAWHGDPNRVHSRGLSSAADAARFAASVGASGLLLSSRGALCNTSAAPQACTAAQSRELEAQAVAAAPGLTVVAPDDLHLAVVGHADDSSGA